MGMCWHLPAGEGAALHEQGSTCNGKANKAQFLAQCKGLVATLFASVPSPPTTPQPAAGGTPTHMAVCVVLPRSNMRVYTVVNSSTWKRCVCI